MWLNSRWAMVRISASLGRLASVGFISVGGLWCSWCAVVARVGFVVVGVGVAWWVGWVWAWLIFFFFVVVAVAAAVVVMVVYCS